MSVGFWFTEKMDILKRYREKGLDNFIEEKCPVFSQFTQRRAEFQDVFNKIYHFLLLHRVYSSLFLLLGDNLNLKFNVSSSALPNRLDGVAEASRFPSLIPRPLPDFISLP